MNDDEVIILSVETGEAVRNVGELKDNIKAYKEALDVLDVGSKEYADTLSALQVNQAALKNAMHATTSEGETQGRTMEQIAKDAMGLGTSYNSLVRQMALLDQQFRAEEDAVKRAQLGSQIKNINAQLKELDEARGKFGRNVGNYKSALDGIASGFRATAGGAASVLGPVQGVTAGLKALSATPVIGVLGLLAGALDKVIKGLKSSEENTARWNKVLGAFKPIADAATRTIQSLGNFIAKTAEGVVDLLEKWGWMTDAMREGQALAEKDAEIAKLARQYMVQNAESAKVAAEDRAKAAQKDKYTAQQRLAFLEDAYREEKAIAMREMDLAKRRLAAAEARYSPTENSKEENDELARLRADAINAEAQFYQKVRRLQSQMVTERREIMGQNKAINAEAVADEQATAALLIESADEILAALTAVDQRRAEQKALQDKQVAEGAASLESAWAQQTAALQEELDAQLTAEMDAAAREREIQQQRINTFVAFTGGISQLASSLADVYEADADASEKAAQKSKALQISAAVISTIGGAVSAFMSTWKAPELGLMAKSILAPINAAGVLAAGYAQIRQIQSTKVGKGGGGAAPAMVSPPSMAVPGAMQQVRTVTGASEEDRLNRMASDQKVYLVTTELEAKMRDRQVALAEASF